MDILKNKGTLLLLGNEAVVRGALESGVNVATTYPGTPASEIGDTFSKIAKKADIYFEYSVNEKVAAEVAIGASVSGLRSIVSMKHVGLNVASDALATIAYSGVRGALVIAVADDPSCYSSQNEQDSRYYALLMNLPMLEPSTSQEAKDMTKAAFKLSEKLELPVFLRLSTRVSHVRENVKLGKIMKNNRKGCFEKNPMRFVNVPAGARIGHKRLLSQMEKAKDISEKSNLNQIVKIGKKPKIGIITSGVSYTYTMEAVKKLGIDASILKLGIVHPLPEKMCEDFINSFKKIVVVEELEPYLEKQIKALGAKNVHGKTTNDFPRTFEYTPDIVFNSMAKILGKKTVKTSEKLNAPSRPPVLCPGCSHRATFYAAKIASKDKAIYSTDIGCYALGVQLPLATADLLMCMGGGVGAAGGISKATKQKVIAFIGDSTFFHAGIPALINAVYNNHKFVYTILDNRTTAMTGHQPHPGTGITGMGNIAPNIKIEDIVRGIGVKFIEILDPYNVKKTISAFRRALEYDGVSVLIARHPCTLLELRKGKKKPYQVNQSKCKECRICIDRFGCPALYVDNKIHINPLLCVGCGVCAQICPAKAIGVKK
ncbi:indolepyruvate ferredoxin oxidoreductase subunit alpha [archaeon]|nr:indolepyruvate ferredoxin oxidoreductase subunit alpha [archaeon]